MRAALTFGLIVVLFGCRGRHDSASAPREPSPVAARPPAPSSSVPLVVPLAPAPSTSVEVPPPLATPEPIVPLVVEGFRDASVSLPVAARGKRPVVVALHGNYDRPEWQCEVWRGITDGFPFVLCPRGIPRGDAPKNEDRWTWGALGQTKKELFAALDALRARYPEHVSDGPVLFTGFSLGAILGRHLLLADASTFPRAVLVEGGYEGWSVGFAKRFRAAGGERVLFACGQTACRHAGKAAARSAEKADVGAKVTFGGNVGHTYDGVVARGVKEELRWLTEGDARWQARSTE